MGQPFNACAYDAERAAYNKYQEAIANEKSILPRLDGIEEGKAEGRAEGEKQKAIAIAKNLIELGTMTTEQIALATGLTITEITQIKHSQ